MDSTRAWRDLRALRSGPPGLATREDRGRVFAAAMEQSEQLMRGAERLGPATRALNLFYGLSQAGRALSAAFTEDNNGWRLIGHGISGPKLYDTEFEDIQLKNHGKSPGSFTAVAQLLGSFSIPEPTRLGTIIATIPESYVPPAPWREEPGPLRVLANWERSASSVSSETGGDAPHQISTDFWIEGHTPPTARTWQEDFLDLVSRNRNIFTY